jgi:hypothetical protein
VQRHLGPARPASIFWHLYLSGSNSINYTGRQWARVTRIGRPSLEDAGQNLFFKTVRHRDSREITHPSSSSSSVLLLNSSEGVGSGKLAASGLPGLRQLWAPSCSSTSPRMAHSSAWEYIVSSRFYFFGYVYAPDPSGCLECWQSCYAIISESGLATLPAGAVLLRVLLSAALDELRD